jgi:hypothetical protein
MAWLEKLAARQGANLDELPTVDEVPTEDFAMPDSVTKLAVAEEKAMAERAAVVKPVEPEVAEVVAEEEAVAESPYDNIPDDPEAAMAWLEKLAARQGANLNELPTVDEVPTEDFDMPDSVTKLAVAEEKAMAERASVPKPVEPAVADDGLDWLTELAGVPDVSDELKGIGEAFGSREVDDYDEPVVEEVVEDEMDVFAEMPADSYDEPEVFDDDFPAEDAGLVDEILGRGVTGALPDWLGMEDAYSSQTSADDWLESIQGDDADWVAPVEEQVAAPVRYEAPKPTPALAPRRFTRMSSRRVEPEAYVVPTKRVPITDDMDLDVDALVAAREALAQNDVNAALRRYEQLVGAGVDMPAIVTDLEIAVNEHRRVPLLTRLLGDAYAEKGDLQRALNTYRQVLDRV